MTSTRWEIDKGSADMKRGVRPGRAARKLSAGWSMVRRGGVRYPARVKAATMLLTILLLISLGAPYLRPLDTRSVDLSASMQPPSWTHPSGTDRLGRDLLAHSVHGLRVSFAVSGMAALVAIGVGSTIGFLAGALGGWVDALVMRSIDVFQAQNHFLFGLLIVILFRPVLGGGAAIMLSVALTHWVTVARIVRGELLSLQERPFVLAAIGGGAGRRRLIRRHFIPHLMPSIVLAFVLLVPHAIFHESGLSFLGLGLPPHQASLGNLLAQSQETLLIGAWWTAFFPGLIIFVTCLCIGILGEYWRDRHHPRWRSELEL